MNPTVKRRKNVTMQDIADIFGVSKVTVSKAVNNKEGIGDDLKQKILEKAEEMGYQIPTDGTGVHNDSIKNVIVFLDHKYFDENLTGYFYVKMYQLISKYLSEKGYGVSLKAVDFENHGKEVDAVVSSSHVVGVVVIGKLEEEFLKKVRTVDMPLVFVDHHDEHSGAACVVSENIYSTYEITQHLIENGHKNIGYVGSIHVTPSIQDRYLGYLRVLLEEHIPHREEWIIDDRDVHNEEIDFVLPKSMPTAFVCNCDETALRFIKELKKKGYRVPQDISIVSFDNDVFAELCEPKLTTVSVDVNQLARMTAYRLDSQVSKGVNRLKKITRVNGNIMYRDSVQSR